MKRVLIVTGIYPPAIGGPATHAETIVRALVKDGCAVTLITFGDEHTVREPGCKMIMISKRPSVVWRYLACCWQVLRHGFQQDVLYVLDTVSVGLPATIANVILRKRLIVRVVGDYAWEQGRGRFGIQDSLDEFQIKMGVARERKRYHWSIQCWYYLQIWVARRAEIVVTPSAYLKAKVGSWGVDPRRVEVVLNVVDVPIAATPIAPTTKEKMLLSIARFTPWKGMVELVEAFAEVVKQIPEARLILIGDGPEKKRIQEIIIRLSLQDVVTIQPPVSHRALPDWYARSYGFVLNTAYEGLSHQLLEVMAAGLPFATTLAGGNVELLLDGNNGRAFPVNDRAAMTQAMIELLSDRPTVLARAQTALEQARRWPTEEQMTAEIKKICLVS